jgi:pyruvate dehydrogenase E2 component (dihydrolipoamide acetyltransferase)
MAEVIRLPRMSDTMTEGVIAEWHKKVGDIVKPGDLMAEVETDKATMELESYEAGTILYIGVEKGKSVSVNGIIAIVGNAGEAFEHLITETDNSAAPVTNAATEIAPTAVQASGAATIDITKIPEAILMPRMSDTMTEAVIANWTKKVGDQVKTGELLAEVETDKATMELESYNSGKLLWIAVEAGGKVGVNELLCIVGDDNTDVNSILAASKQKGTTPVAAQQANTGTIATASTAPVAVATTVSTNGRVKASPLAKKLAQEKGIDINAIAGSGDGGRIIKKDIDGFVPGKSVAAAIGSGGNVGNTAAGAAASFVPTPIANGVEAFTDAPNSQMRKVIAKRLSESKFSAPHFYLKMEINMDNAMAARATLNEQSPVKISFNDLVIKASAMALRKHPAVNSSWMGDFIRTYQHVNIGMAVAMPDGLIVPVIRFADQKSLSHIAAEAKELGGKAKNKKLQPNEFTGNTFTISNLGMMDIDEFTAIVNPPDSCILAVGKIKEVVVRKGEGFGVSNVMTLTLSCDHRSVDGAVGAAFLQTLKAYLENPVTMLI